MRARLRSIALYGAIALASVLFSVVMAEIGYRLILIWQTPETAATTATAAPNMVIYREPFWAYDRANGFNYPRNGTTDLTFIMQDQVVECLSFVSDRNGNPGRDAPVNNPSRRLLVFGDSFTYSAHGEHGDTTWPLLLQDMMAREGHRVEVLNYARDGTGILQMMDNAADKVSRDKADLVVIAFISADMVRPRIWRVVQPDGAGGSDVFATLNPAGRLRSGEYTRATFIDGRATRDWCEQLKKTQKPSAPLLLDIRERFVAMITRDAKRFGAHVDMTDFETSYLWNQIVYKDPYASTRFRNKQMRLQYASFTADPGFNEAVRRLKKSGVPGILVHLPLREEMIRGGYILNDQERSLLDSLITTTGFPVIELLPSRPVAPEAAARLYIADGHPNYDGLELIAASLWKILRAQWAQPDAKLSGGAGLAPN